MRSPSRFVFKLVACSFALMPLFAHADSTHKECSILLTEQECNDFQLAQHQIQSPAEKELFERKYAALLKVKERAQLCRYPIGEEIARATKRELPQKPFKSFKSYNRKRTAM